ncbi:hypothetical protein AOR01nite_11030 [Acetobacter orleanensis]|uniref:Glycosyltransferase 61 catalytic domain-containing protein n=1 Tax=Acetobacter orleanensis TaxID=104099 RepID=A0A4Y3TJX0_9PROT|nr:hypothetical protein Abol_026_011 [Acetobacter orleanensis JCM 7639]GEB82626.1 hypothetical protein AOR01nite_11030 [Acetobacter orleanensis]
MHAYHWKRPTETLNPVGFYTVKDLIVTRPGSTILNTNLVYNCATGLDNQHSVPHEDDYFSQSSRNKIVIEERVIVADGVACDVWGHWLVDYLPRFGVVKAMMGEQFSNLKILLPHSTPEWIYQFLAFACGVSRDKIVGYNPGADIVLCKEAILPSYCYTNEFSFHSFVRDFYNSLTPPDEAVKKTRKILISRSNYMHSNRQLSHRAAFEELALQRGYEIIQPEKLSLEEQIQVFSEAAAVVGEHGSGMHSTLFSAPGTVVGCLGFWNAVQLHIGYLMGHQNVYVTKNCKWPTPERNEYVMDCTPDELNSFLEKVDSLIPQ